MAVPCPDHSPRGAEGSDSWPLRHRARQLYATHWTHFVALAERALFAYARAQAPDLVSDVLIDLARGTFRTLPDRDAQAVSFVAAVIRHRAAHVNRREARLVRLFADDLASDAGDPLNYSMRVALAEDVALALAQLPPRQREVASMHWLDGLSSVEIASRLAISVRTIKELLRRARQRLRLCLAGYVSGA